MPYLLLKTLISLHCGNPSSNVSYFEVLKAFLTSACGWRSLLEKMGNTLGKSGECCGVMLEFENVEMTNLLNWCQMRRSGLSGWREKVGYRKRSLKGQFLPRKCLI
ncbi:hypothetical protein LC653_24080 [Nostoc sp. CHAB 5784]|uniref:hypothetical protein n=1 Tax=Nostoc mirabile TaxID=2907820 RepID=UPI001E35E76D|nr:hypothetical protein [Nostoc mirabile]MCC5666887.1 hypothetical protein [Nostoc mirabile CHAB5784]